MEYTELGLNRLGATELNNWSEQRFCSGNAVLWMTAPPPSDLSLPLPPGERQPVQLPDPVIQFPAWMTTYKPGVGVSTIVERSTAAILLCAYLDEKMKHALRHEGGVSYAPGCMYLPISDDRAQVVLWADCLEENQPTAWTALRTVLKTTQNGEIAEATFERLRKLMLRSMDDPQAAPGIIEGEATQILDGREPLDLYSEVQAVTIDQLVEIFAGIESDGLYLLPIGEKIPGVEEVSNLSSGAPAEGKDYKPYVSRGEVQKVSLGEEGISYHVKDGHLTVTFDECEALLRWKDGYRTILGSDGMGLSFHPDEWRSGNEIADRLDSRLRAVLIPMIGKSPLEQERENTPQKVEISPWVWLAAFIAVGGWALVFSPDSPTDERIFGLVMGIVLTGYVVYQLYGYWRRRRSS